MPIAPDDRPQVFCGVVIHSTGSTRLEVCDPGYLTVVRGRIAELTRVDPRPKYPGAAFQDFGRKIVLPGFIDTHVHLPQFGIMGIGKGELLDWLNNYTYPEEARFSDPEYATRISAAFFDALVANGTTTAMIYSSVHEQATDIAFSAAQAKGVRAFIGKVMMDRNSPPSLTESTDESIAASTRLFEKWDGVEDGRLRYVFTPRFAAACSMDLMKRTGQLAHERNAFIQSHLSENKNEVKWIRELFPDVSSYAEVYDAAGLLNERSVMAHCIHLSLEEVSLLYQRQTRIAFCPYSNRTLHSGVMPYRTLANANLDIGLGTDVAGGPSLSMFEQMREAMNAAGIGPAEALFLATAGGAKVLGLSEKVGSLSAGHDADFIVADAGPYGTPEEALSKLCMNGSQDQVREVYVRGRLVYF